MNTIAPTKLVSHYEECKEHKTQFGQNDTYILVTVTTPLTQPFQVAQFQACNYYCASNHLLNWLHIRYNVSFQYSTPEIRSAINKKLSVDKKSTITVDASIS